MNRTVKTLTTIIMICVMMLTLAACSDGPIGFWEITEVTTGDVVMTVEDAKNIGLNSVGSVTLRKSGTADVTLVGEDYEGEWNLADDGTMTIVYGNEDEVLTGTIDEEAGVMTLTDSIGSTYKLEK